MNKSKAIKIAIAFKRGAAFIRGMRQLAQDEKYKDLGDGVWRTIDTDAEGHGGRKIFIRSDGTIGAGLSKAVIGMKLGDAIKALKDKEAGKKAETAQGPKIGDYFIANKDKFVKGSFVHALCTANGDSAESWDNTARKLDKVFENYPDDYKTVIMDTVGSIGFESTNKIAHYSPLKQDIALSRDILRGNQVKYNNMVELPFHTVVHELGHAIDNLNAKSSDVVKYTKKFRYHGRTIKSELNSDAFLSNKPEFIDAIKKDLGSYVSDLRKAAEDELIKEGNYDPKYKSSRYERDRKAADLISRYGEDNPIFVGVSDMVQGYTRGEITDGAAHPLKYYSTISNDIPVKLPTETVAHIFEAYLDPKGAESFRKLFPNIMGTFDKLMSDRARELRGN